MAFFITLFAVGCSNSSNSSSNNGSDKYTTYMSQGKDAASSQKYEAAEEKFEDAHDVKQLLNQKPMPIKQALWRMLKKKSESTNLKML